MYSYSQLCTKGIGYIVNEPLTGTRMLSIFSVKFFQVILAGFLQITAGQTHTERVIEITTSGIDLSYNITEIEAVAGEEITIRYVNASETMAHNIVLLNKEEDIRPVGIAALRAHRNAYIPEGEMERILAYSTLVQPGDTTEFTFTVPPPGIYPYICTYSGHFTMMQGRLISTP